MQGAAAGIVFGLGAALFQSLSYVASRWFLKRSGRDSLTLMGTSHVWMGLASLILLPFFNAGQPPFRSFLVPLAGAAGYYILGQAGLFAALQRSDSSRVAPLLGLKIFVLALIGALFMGERLGAPQWAAVGMSVAAALILNHAGGRLTGASVAALALAIVAYSLSDLSIKSLVVAMKPAGWRAPMLAVCWCYIVCGAAGSLMIAGRRWPGPGVWAAAAPFAFFWFGGMVLLYITFDLIGVVFGNIIQSTRGLVSIALGVAVARWGLLDIEARLAVPVIWRRIAGAALMSAAIAAFLLGRR